MTQGQTKQTVKIGEQPIEVDDESTKALLSRVITLLEEISEKLDNI